MHFKQEKILEQQYSAYHYFKNSEIDFQSRQTGFTGKNMFEKFYLNSTQSKKINKRYIQRKKLTLRNFLYKRSDGMRDDH